jgi:ABC transport system ATP-binding/permease protein
MLNTTDPTPLISLKNLSLNFPHKKIFDKVTFTLNQGDRIGVLGLNGHGKSSLFKIIAGVLTPDKTVPEFIYDKSKDFNFFYVPQELNGLEGYSVSNYFYEFYPELKKLKLRLDIVNDQLSHSTKDFEKLLNEQTSILEKLHDLGDDRIQSGYLSYLKAFGIVNVDRSMTDLSGGEQRKVALALGLSAPNELILWDEPTNHLDLETIEAFEDELNNVKKTFMMISHDRSLLNNVVDRIIHIQQGQLRSFQGSYEQYLQFLKEDQLRREKELDKLSNFQRRETAWIRRGVSARRTKSKKRIEDYSTLNKKIDDLKSMALKSVSLNLQSSGRKSKLLLEARDLSLSFGNRLIFDKLNFSLQKGDKIALIGKNGAGKSSLLKILLGHLSATSGDIGKPAQLDIGYFSQKREVLDDQSTPWELIGEGIDYVISNTGEKKHVASYLENFLFSSDELKRPIHTFSGGEKNRLQLAQFMKHARDIWIFDEPTNDLDLETIGILEEELKNYEGALIVVGHDRSFIENVTQKCWYLHDQRLDLFDGGYGQAAAMIEAMNLEKILQTSTPSPQDKNISQGSGKISNKEKNRLAQLPGLIEDIEKGLQLKKQELDLFDYTSTDVARLNHLKSLNLDIQKQEEKLLVLYQEWEDLESRQI